MSTSTLAMLYEAGPYLAMFAMICIITGFLMRLVRLL